MTQTVDTPPAPEATPRPLLGIIVDHVGQPLPEGCDRWGIRAVHPDLRSSNGYRWPWPGNWAQAPGPILDHRGSCPQAVGDGICTATTAAGMASGGIRAHTILLTAHSAADVIGDSEQGKARLRRAMVVDVVDLPGLARDGLLGGANLRDANLVGANLWGANLGGANLGDANLWGANLGDADLWGADLWGANLRGANLRGADLWGANLGGADLWGADLWGANLGGADLGGANLRGWQRGPDGYARRVAAQ